MLQDASLRAVISGWFESLAAADNTWRDRHVSRDPNLRIIGTDPVEFLRGEAAYAFLKTEADNVGGMLKIAVGDVEAFSHGDIGWGVARPTIALPDGRTVNLRWSGVFRKEDGVWKLVQLHASIAMANAEAFGDSVTFSASA
jgi:ketosteroid isomerase-like protein